MSSLLHRLGVVFFRQRIIWALFILSLNALALWNIYSVAKTDGFPVDFSPQSIFIDNGEIVQRLGKIEEKFGREDNDFIIVLDGKGVPTPEGKSFIADLERRFSRLEGIDTVRSLVDAKRMVSSSGLIEIQDIWAEEDPFTAAKEDRFLHPALISADRQSTVLQVRVRPEIQSIHDLEPILTKITEELYIDVPDNIDIHVTGVPYIRVEVVQMIWEDNLFYIPIVATIFLITIMILFRGFWNAMTPVVAVLMSMIWSVSFLVSLGATFNILSVLVPMISLIIGIADGIHVVARYREELLLDQDREKALGRTIQSMFWACFLTSFTTGAGFASLMIADTIVIQDFGFHSAIAVVTTFFGVMMVIPVFLAFIPAHKIGHPVSERKWEERFFTKIEDIVWRFPRQIMLMSFILTLGVGFYVSDMKADSNIMEMYHPKHPTWKAIELVDTKLSGIVPTMLNFEVKEGTVLDPVVLEKALRLEQEMKKYEFIAWQYSLTQQLIEIHYALSGERELPATTELIAQEILMAEMAGELPIDRVLSTDQTMMRSLALSRDVGGAVFIVMKKELEEKAHEIFGEDPNILVDVTGDGFIATVGIDKLIRDLFSSIFLVFGVIFVVLFVMVRKFPMAVIALIPNAIPLLLTLATLKLMGSDLQVTNIVSFTVAIGIAVDDTIHFIARYQSERRAGKEHREAIQASFHGAGHAIILTSILLVLGFGVLTGSTLSSTYFFGVLTAMTLLGAIFADLFLLPAMMNWWTLRGDKKAS